MAQRKIYHFNDLFDTMVYPAGEPHVRLKQFKNDPLPGDGSIAFELRALSPYFRPFIIAEAHDWNGIMRVALADEILKANGVGATFVIPYFPFARHDRRNDTDDSSPVPWVLQLLESVDAVSIDPHSDVAGVLPHYAQREVVLEFSELGIFDENPVIVIPDAGAAKKAYSWIPKGFDYIQALKTRDPATGALSGFQVIDVMGTVTGRSVVIIDDICDGGGTFIGLANELKKMGAGSLRLGVTHGLFTKGVAVLLDHFSSIFTLDTYTPSPEFSDKVITASTEKIVLEGKYF